MSIPFKRLRDEAQTRANSRTGQAPLETKQPTPRVSDMQKKREGLMRAPRYTSAPEGESLFDNPFVESVLGLGGSFRDKLGSRFKTSERPSGILGGLIRGIEDASEDVPEGEAAEGSAGYTESGDSGYTESGDSFVNKLIQSESGGDSKAEITIKDGRRFVGAGQFGEARLADYKRATGTSFTQNEFQDDGALQSKVMAWHIKDIDKAIDAVAGSDKFSRDGLRAVAHLGGIGGMQKYVKTGGKYNPSDELGTSLSKYYNRFS